MSDHKVMLQMEILTFPFSICFNDGLCFVCIADIAVFNTMLNTAIHNMQHVTHMTVP